MRSVQIGSIRQIRQHRQSSRRALERGHCVEITASGGRSRWTQRLRLRMALMVAGSIVSSAGSLCFDEGVRLQWRAGSGKSVYDYREDG
jgi:hypothetical protein